MVGVSAYPDPAKWTDGAWPQIAQAVGGKGLAIGIAQGIAQALFEQVRYDGQGHPLERHCQRQAHPLGSHTVNHARQARLVALDLVVVPATQIKRPVGRTMQHRRKRMLDR